MSPLRVIDLRSAVTAAEGQHIQSGYRVVDSPIKLLRLRHISSKLPSELGAL